MAAVLAVRLPWQSNGSDVAVAVPGRAREKRGRPGGVSVTPPGRRARPEEQVFNAPAGVADVIVAARRRRSLSQGCPHPPPAQGPDRPITLSFFSGVDHIFSWWIAAAVAGNRAGAAASLDTDTADRSKHTVVDCARVVPTRIRDEFDSPRDTSRDL